jgi:hypothetical protein
MLWIKRNLFLAIGGLVAIALLVAGGLYVSNGLSKNKSLGDEVEGTRTRLNAIYAADPFPHSTNISAAKAETAKLRGAITKTRKYFAPVEAERVDVRAFRTLLGKTIEDLRVSARDARTQLPSSSYAFSFETQKLKADFGPGTFPVVPQQIMEVKALCTVLFAAGVHSINNIRRARVSADDRASTIGGDYLAPVLANQTITVASAESHPYELTYYCFSSELAQVLNGLARSPHGFTVKALMTEPEGGGAVADAGLPGMAAAEVAPPNNPGVRPPPGGVGPGGRFGTGGRPPGGVNPPPRPGVVQPPKPAGTDRPVILLKEKRLKVTMLVYAIK